MLEAPTGLRGSTTVANGAHKYLRHLAAVAVAGKYALGRLLRNLVSTLVEASTG